MPEGPSIVIAKEALEPFVGEENTGRKRRSSNRYEDAGRQEDQKDQDMGKAPVICV